MAQPLDVLRPVVFYIKLVYFAECSHVALKVNINVSTYTFSRNAEIVNYSPISSLYFLVANLCCILSATRNATLVNTYVINHYTGITIIHMTRQSKSYCSSAKVGKEELVTNTECRSLREERLVVIIVRSSRCHTHQLHYIPLHHL